MMLADLLATLATQGALLRSRVPAMKTSLKYLASALGYSSLEQCPVAATCREEATWAGALEDHWRTLETEGRPTRAYTRRNTRNDIRKVFTLAEAHGLLTAPLPARLLPRPDNREVFRRQQRATAPYKTTYGDHRGRRYWLPQAEWPPDIQEGWRTYRVACGQRIRGTSFQSYVNGPDQGTQDTCGKKFPLTTPL